MAIGGGNLLGIGYLQIQVAMSSYNSQMNALQANFASRMAAMNGMARGLMSGIGGGRGMGGLGFGGAAGLGKAAGGFALGLGLVKAIKEASEFEQAMANVRAVTQATDEDFNKLTEAAREMGRATKFSAVQAANALEEMGKLGMSAENSIAALPGALQLAAAGELSMAEAASIAGRNLNVFGKDVSQLNEVNDILAAAATKSATDIKSLAVALSYAGPSAKAAGMSLAQTAAILASMADAGIEGSRAGAALRNVIEALRTPSKKQKGILAEMGIDPAAFKDAKTGFLDVIGFLEAIEKAGGTNRAVELFGKRGGTEIMAAMGSEGREEFGPGVTGMRDRERAIGSAVGIAKKMADIRMNTFSGQIEKLVSAFSDLAIQLGGPVMKVLGGFVFLATEAANALTELDRALGGAIGWALAVSVAVVGLGIVVWGVTAAFGALAAVLGLLVANPVTAGIIILTGLIVALASAIANADTTAANASGFTGFAARAKLAFQMLTVSWKLTLEWMYAFAALKLAEMVNLFLLQFRLIGDAGKAIADGLKEGFSGGGVGAAIDKMLESGKARMGKSLAERSPIEEQLRKELAAIEEEMRAKLKTEDEKAAAVEGGAQRQINAINAAAAAQAAASSGDSGVLSEIDEYYDRVLEGIAKVGNAAAGAAGAGGAPAAAGGAPVNPGAQPGGQGPAGGAAAPPFLNPPQPIAGTAGAAGVAPRQSPQPPAPAGQLGGGAPAIPPGAMEDPAAAAKRQIDANRAKLDDEDRRNKVAAAAAAGAAAARGAAPKESLLGPIGDEAAKEIEKQLEEIGPIGPGGREAAPPVQPLPAGPVIPQPAAAVPRPEEIEKVDEGRRIPLPPPMPEPPGQELPLPDGIGKAMEALPDAMRGLGDDNKEGDKRAEQLAQEQLRELRDLKNNGLNIKNIKDLLQPSRFA